MLSFVSATSCGTETTNGRLSKNWRRITKFTVTEFKKRRNEMKMIDIKYIYI